MEEISNKITPEYFAAANSYKGFVSYFDKAFASEDFDRIYVLKGGPGTGKSSFMKRIGESFSARNYDIERILCSSDPRSLDGVIISNGKRKIALIDGTAPHERDAKIPGAIDEIINLGNGWNSAWLTYERKKIIELGNEKSKAYKTAYNYLRIAGGANDFIKSVVQASFDEYKAKSEAELIFKEIPRGKGAEKTTRLISCFGKDGEGRLSTLDLLELRKISVNSTPLYSGLFLNICLNILESKSQKIIHFPNVLDPDETDAIYLSDHNLLITKAADGEVNADDFFNISEVEEDRIKRAKEIKVKALDEAVRWFKIASDMHFRLEEIYGAAMNFEINERLLKEKISEIDLILEKQI